MLANNEGLRNKALKQYFEEYNVVKVVLRF